jgi:hypothetical protein
MGFIIHALGFFGFDVPENVITSGNVSGCFLPQGHRASAKIVIISVSLMTSGILFTMIFCAAAELVDYRY